MATDKTWVSADGNLNAAASWSPSGVPAAADSVYFNASSQQDVVSGLDAFPSITRLHVQPEYGGNIGADGNALETTPRSLIHQGTGSFFYKPVTNAIDLSYILVDSPNLQDAFTVVVGGNTATYHLYIRRGSAQLLNNTAGWNNIAIGGTTGIGPFVTIGSDVGEIERYRQTSGIVTTKTPLSISTSTGPCIIDGGTLTYHASGTAAWWNPSITGGTFIYNGTGTLNNPVIHTGFLDMSQDSRAKTVGGLIILPAGMFAKHPNVTVTAATFVDLRDRIPVFP